MKKIKWKFDIDWKSKIIDLLIVIIGITIAFQLNNLNESNKSKTKEIDYLKNFYNENATNESSLILELEYCLEKKKNIATLKQILSAKKYKDNSIKNLAAGMMAFSSFSPSIITMENITASGQFELIRNIELRENLIDTYNSYETTSQLEGLLSEYAQQYVSPFFFENVRFSDFSSLKEDFAEKAEFENIVIGYDALLTQKIDGYKLNLKKLKKLNLQLTAVNNAHK
jgi:hypothetical protein